MTDNYINVTVTSKENKRVTVSTQEPGFEVTATTDTGKFWAQTAENWAISDVKVDNKDYSSKYYANKSKSSAENASIYEKASKEIYNSLLTESDNLSDEIRITANEALENIQTTKINAVDDINSTKTNILKDIEFVADGEKKEIENLIDSGKEELKESIGDVKVLTTLEIGDIGFTQMAIDESKGKRRVLNGQLIIQDQYVQFTNIIKQSVALNPDLACTEAEWQTAVTMSTNGVCDKFVIDDEGGTIRLPKYPNYFITGGNAPVVGNGMSLGLTDGNTAFSGLAYNTSAGLIPRKEAYGVLLPKTYSTSSDDFINQSVAGVVQDPTKSGLEAKLDSAELVKGTYFIQVATGSETEDNIINEIELNNPFSLLDYKYSEYELNNISWLRSNGQYNSKAVYPAVYDLLLKIYNGTETKAGVSVKLSSETFTDYDFVLNTAEETFRLPIKVKLASGKAVVGNGMSIGLLGENNPHGLYANTSGYLVGANSTYGLPIGSPTLTDTRAVSQALGLTTDPTKSGLELSDSDLYLYFYVGETVQNANLINAGRIEEKLVNLIPDNSELIVSYGLPDYSAGIDIKTTLQNNKSYTAPTKGVLFNSMITTNKTEIKINGYSVGIRQYSTYGNYIPTPYYLNAGDVFSVTGWADSNGSAYFFPLKGAK